MKQLLVLVLSATIICWLMFSPIYKHVLIMRHAALQKEVDYLLEIGASARFGYIDQQMIAASKTRLQEKGFLLHDLTYRVETTTGQNGMDPQSPALRGVGIKLEITYPYHRLFVVDQLIGLSTPDPTDRMGAQGMKMSEYVP